MLESVQSKRRGRSVIRDGDAYHDQAFKAETTGFILAVVYVNQYDKGKMILS